tara:strand:- start:2960 stop:3124 length:165 start_codon:yes stop_codon:yes gene_type:complete
LAVATDGYREKDDTQKKVTGGDQANPKRLAHLYASKESVEKAVERGFEELTSDL